MVKPTHRRVGGFKADIYEKIPAKTNWFGVIFTIFIILVIIGAVTG